MAMEPFLACSVPALLSILITLDCSHGKQKPSDESEMGAADFSEILIFFNSKSIKKITPAKKNNKNINIPIVHPQLHCLRATPCGWALVHYRRRLQRQRKLLWSRRL